MTRTLPRGDERGGQGADRVCVTPELARLEGAAAALRYLVSTGRTHIATVTAPMHLSTGRDRYEGHVQGLVASQPRCK